MATDPQTEPWFHGPAAKALGPVEVVYQPHAQVVISLRARITLASIVAVAGPVIMLAFRYGDGNRLSPELGGDLVFPYLVIVVLGLLYAGLLPFWFSWYRESQRRLLVGPKGLVEWTPTGETFIRWSQLGTEWQPAVPEQGSWPWQYVPWVVALVHTNGQRWQLSGMYEGAEEIVQRLSGQMLRQEMGEIDSEPDEPTATDELLEARTPLMRHESLNPGEDSPWLRCQEAWQLEPLERVCSLTEKSEGWLNAKVFLANAIYAVVGLCVFPSIGLLTGAIPRSTPENPELEVGPGSMALLLASLVYVSVCVFWSNFVFSPAVTFRVRLVVGSGGIVVWTEYRIWLIRWADLAPETQRIATAPPPEQEALFIRVLWNYTNARNGNLDPAARFTSGDWLVSRYLEEMRLRG